MHIGKIFFTYKYCAASDFEFSVRFARSSENIRIVYVARSLVNSQFRMRPRSGILKVLHNVAPLCLPHGTTCGTNIQGKRPQKEAQ
jgi:hypothetical protein